MKYKRFEDLPVWQDSIRFSVSIYDFTSQSNGLFTNLGDLKNQIERASLSISNNIAEGFERGSVNGATAPPDPGTVASSRPSAVSVIRAATSDLAPTVWLNGNTTQTLGFSRGLR